MDGGGRWIDAWLCGWDDFYWMVVADGLMPGSVAGMTSTGWWWQMD